ncbi:Exodeoxyribonuclease 7 small subunit [Neorhodopirellula pilleata]|uniref:Exodeoxyribonuclease 7 small subunit n=1 Tax=Neorhodopirellula pilleata TaxID=2714738 RepID=A0A5C6AAB0_9BACT|nr:Exodeoxyribonuclease 7 small subunit [Neorhodopirellula pilleata]
MAKKKTNASANDDVLDANNAQESDAPIIDVPVDFETALGEIEKIVRALESGELSLDASLKQYESAVAKMRQCYRLLEIAERKISVLAGFDAEGNPVTEPLEER